VARELELFSAQRTPTPVLEDLGDRLALAAAIGARSCYAETLSAIQVAIINAGLNHYDTTQILPTNIPTITMS